MKIVRLFIFALILAAAVPGSAQDFRHPKHRGAPEPLTLIGLGLGAGALGAAAWHQRRRGKK